ncbi:MAG: glycerol-3-phosphate dehydrogenase/oxidase [Oligoflexales bacterium]|nr:glycerol-3-phosphate dehydrogenase/oxidase [Oligoflexales bacterium]
MHLRDDNKKKLLESTFDVLVIGGGINGAVSAAALAGQGVYSAVIDKGDFAGVTSQHSSNLIWGGIKYMESYEFPLVRKLCLSRNRLMMSFPSSVREIRFYANIDRKSKYGRFFIYLGTWLYFFLGSCFTKPPRLLSKKKIQKELPVINTANSTGGVEYSDCYLVENDARFVFSFIRKALDSGAVAVNYIEALSSSKAKNGVWETKARDRTDGSMFTIKSRSVINATGPFVDSYNLKSNQKTDHKHVFSKGIHIIVDSITSSGKIITFFADDNRLFFVIPMGERSCIGTTDTRIESMPPEVTDEDRKYILENINKRLNLNTPLSKSDIISERCGVRPLVIDRSKGVSADSDWTVLSRKHIIETDREQKYISIFGGKLTDCLNIGNEIVREMEKMGFCRKGKINKWYGEPSAELYEKFSEEMKSVKTKRENSVKPDSVLIERLWRCYGSHAFEILEYLKKSPESSENIVSGTDFSEAELQYLAKYEMIVRLEDFTRRRSKIALTLGNKFLFQNAGLKKASEILFGDLAEERYNELLSSIKETGGEGVKR